MITEPLRTIHRRIAAISATAVMAVVVVACSLPVDERVTPIDHDQFGAQLTEDTTTTTTEPATTTTSAPTTAPDVSTPDGEITTTTVAAIPTETVTVFYTRGFTDILQPIEFELAAGTPTLELVPLLERPSTQLRDAGLRSSVQVGLIDDITPERLTANVSLDPAVLDRMSNDDQQRAIAQIVLTLTSFRTPDTGNIGSVRFVVDGEGYPVFVPAFGGTSAPGEPLTYLDFASLISTTPAATTTTTTTTTTLVTRNTEAVGDDATTVP